MGRIFKWMGSREQARELWENKEALTKYMNRLRDLMMADSDARMTDDETPLAARIRAELYNSGLRGKEFIQALKERLMKEHRFDVPSGNGNNATLQAKKLSNENAPR